MKQAYPRFIFGHFLFQLVLRLACLTLTWIEHFNILDIHAVLMFPEQCTLSMAVHRSNSAACPHCLSRPVFYVGRVLLLFYVCRIFILNGFSTHQIGVSI